jgi:hypothetical protein
LKDKSVFSADMLASLDEAKLTEILGGRKLPQMPERVRLLREVGSGLKARYGGHAANMIRQAGGSAEDLVGRITEAFPGFRDHAVYSGCQVFFYKRAQIFVGDVWGAYGGSGLGDFGDINRLTMFADYRVPQILQAKGVMVYGQDLKALVDSGSQLPSGGAAESEIRAVTVQVDDTLTFLSCFGLVWFDLVGFSFNASLGPQLRARKRGRLSEAALARHALHIYSANIIPSLEQLPEHTRLAWEGRSTRIKMT